MPSYVIKQPVLPPPVEEVQMTFTVAEMEKLLEIQNKLVASRRSFNDELRQLITEFENMFHYVFKAYYKETRINSPT